MKRVFLVLVVVGSVLTLTFLWQWSGSNAAVALGSWRMALDSPQRHPRTGLLILILSGGKSHDDRQKQLKQTWLDTNLDWGVDFRTFMFSNLDFHKVDKDEKSASNAYPGEVLVECPETAAAMNKCCLRARQLRFAVEYLATWRDFEWVLLLDDDHYPILPRLANLLEENRSDKPLALGLTGCVSKPCRGFCGGAGIYFNRPLVELLQKYVEGTVQSVLMENWIYSKCNECKKWADLTTTELLNEINRQEYEKLLFLGPGSKGGLLGDEMAFSGNIPDEDRAIEIRRVSEGLHYSPTKSDELFKAKKEDESSKLFHYDFRKHGAEIHEAMVPLAKAH